MAWFALAFMAVAEVAEGAAERNWQVAKANQMRSDALSVEAQSQRAANEETRQAEIVMSRARAVAAASGGSVTDPTVTNILGDIGAEGEYRALSQLWNGDQEALGLRYGADLSEFEGKVALEAGFLNAAGTVFSGYSGMKGKYSTPKIPKGRVGVGAASSSTIATLPSATTRMA